MQKMMLVLIAAAMCAVLGGCAGLIPTTSYIPQNVIRYEHKNSVDVGTFTYVPELEGERDANQLQFVGIGDIHISTSVSEMVKRATGLELEKTGIFLNDLSGISVNGDVLIMKANVIGFSMTWDYTIRYKIIQKKGQKLLLSKEYQIPTKRTGKFNTTPSDYSQIINEMVLTGYEMFIRDPEVRALLDMPPSH